MTHQDAVNLINDDQFIVLRKSDLEYFLKRIQNNIDMCRLHNTDSSNLSADWRKMVKSDAEFLFGFIPEVLTEDKG